MASFVFHAGGEAAAGNFFSFTPRGYSDIMQSMTYSNENCERTAMFEKMELHKASILAHEGVEYREQLSFEFRRHFEECERIQAVCND